LGIFLAVYAVLLFLGYKVYSAAKRYEEAGQRGSIPVNPVLAQQPVLAYAPGYYPANIPMGAPVNQ
jgi:hypothetical protein